MAYQYANVLTDERWAYPCVDRKTYASRIVGETGSLKLPVEQRVKPTDLIMGMTPRPEQYTFVRKCAHLTWTRPYTAYCGVGYRTSHDYPMETYLADPPVVNWELSLRNKIQADKVSLAETIGEWRESVGYLHGSVKVLQKAWRKMKTIWRLRRNRRALARWFKSQFKRSPNSKVELQDAVSIDLAVKFGIVPMAGLLMDSLEALNRIQLAYRRIQVTVKGASYRTVDGPYSGSCRSTYERSVRAVAYVKYDVNSSEFTAGNLAESLWAGTSLSFVIDWFWDIGSYLSSFNAMQGVTAFRAAICTRDRVSVVSDFNRAGASYVCVKPHIYLKRSYKRDVITTIPYAHLPKPKLPDGFIWGRLWSSTEILSTMRRTRG